jgi:hypothetical protein
MDASAAMGIDDRHRVFGDDGLYVIDGSALSADREVNPALTISAGGAGDVMRSSGDGVASSWESPSPPGAALLLPLASAEVATCSRERSALRHRSGARGPGDHADASPSLSSLR